MKPRQKYYIKYAVNNALVLPEQPADAATDEQASLQAVQRGVKKARHAKQLTYHR